MLEIIGREAESPPPGVLYTTHGGGRYYINLSPELPIVWAVVDMNGDGYNVVLPSRVVKRTTAVTSCNVTDRSC